MKNVVYFIFFIFYSIATPLLSQGGSGSQLRITWLIVFSFNNDLIFEFSLNLANICFCSVIVLLKIFSYLTSIFFIFKSVWNCKLCGVAGSRGGKWHDLSKYTVPTSFVGTAVPTITTFH